jgi:regulator of protease activity HflC (stomatin/prohibitin superfamily)
MNATTIILIVLAAFVIIFAASGIRIIQQSQTMIIERLGKYYRTLPSGINIIIPIIDKPRQIIFRYVREDYDGRKMVTFKSKDRIDLRETVYDFPRQNVITKDNVGTEINALLYFQIMDPVKAMYEIENLPNAIEKLTQTTLRNVIGELDLDDTLTSRDTINSKLRLILDEATNKWGVKVNRVELQDINPPADIREAMEKQMRAERDRRAKILEAEGMKKAQILEAEGYKESQINQAEGEKQAAILKAEGDAEARIKVANAEAQAIRKIVEAVEDKGDPVNYMVALKYLETFRQMVEGKDNKTIYLPYEASGILSSIGGIKDLLKNN